MVEVVFKNSLGLKLLGHLVTPESQTQGAVILSHGFMMDRYERGHFPKMAEVLKNNGLASLLFDYTGSGQSEDTAITVTKHTDDLLSAICFIKTLGYRRIGLLGVSLGGLYSILAYTDEISAIVLWAPVTAAKVPGKLKEPWVLKDFEEQGYTLLKNKAGRVFKVDKQYYQQRLSVDQEAVLSRVHCPVLILHGSQDTVVPSSHSERAIKYLPQGSRLWIIQEADHSFAGHLDLVITLSSDWLSRFLL